MLPVVKDMLFAQLVDSWTPSVESMFHWSSMYKRLDQVMPKATEWIRLKGLDYVPFDACFMRGVDNDAFAVSELSVAFGTVANRKPSDEVFFRQVLYKKIQRAEAELMVALGVSPLLGPPKLKENPEGWLCERPRSIVDAEGRTHIFLLAWPESHEPWDMVNELSTKTRDIFEVSDVVRTNSKFGGDRWAYI